MGRKPGDPGSNGARRRLWIIPLVAFILCYLGYMALSSPQRRTASISSVFAKNSEEDECCRGVDGMELWGAAVKWGTDHKLNTSKGCCLACKEMCERSDGPCLCDSWVFCGDRKRCGEKFGECWLKKQKDTLLPDVKQSDENIMWTSGLVFGKGEGIIGLETDYGTLHIRLLPDCAPHSMAYIVELLGLHHCAGCQFHRAEGRGSSWDSKGNHIQDASLGPPYALIQGTLEAEGVPFKNIPIEACPSIRRGSVAWVGSGPEFFISLANHDEWQKTYTVFGSVLSDDMGIAEKIAQLPTRSERWSNIDVSVLEKPVKLKLKRTTESHGDLNLNTN